MTIRRQIETISFIGMAIFLGSFFVWRHNQNFQKQFHIISPIVAENKTPIITPVINLVVKIDTAEQISPDGAKKLVMKTTHNANGTLTYEFTTVDTTTNNQQPLYTATLTGSESISIPFNTWSPDNKYVFIQKDGNRALVFKASGGQIVTDQMYLDVLDTFTTKGIKDTPAETTGWASPTLLIVNTTTTDNTKGSSYWFEVPTQAIIQLASQF